MIARLAGRRRGSVSAGGLAGEHRFYADRQTRSQQPDEVRAFLDSSKTAYVLMLREDFAAPPVGI